VVGLIGDVDICPCGGIGVDTCGCVGVITSVNFITIPISGDPG